MVLGVFTEVDGSSFLLCRKGVVDLTLAENVESNDFCCLYDFVFIARVLVGSGGGKEMEEDPCQMNPRYE